MANKTRVFISWSKPRSQRIATALHNWLTDVVQQVDPFVSPRDIDAGSMWVTEIIQRIQASTFGIVCLTPDNLDAPWLLFEAGALAIRMAALTADREDKPVRLVPYLCDLKPNDLSGPLSLFYASGGFASNAHESGKDGTFALVESLNKITSEPLQETQLRKQFERCWPELERILREADSEPRESARKPELTDQVQEILSLTRGIAGKLQTLRHQPAFADGRLGDLAAAWDPSERAALRRAVALHTAVVGSGGLEMGAPSVAGNPQVSPDQYSAALRALAGESTRKDPGENG